ncbi:MAG: TRAP transporter small permease [Burkholderiaceae bacterium]
MGVVRDAEAWLAALVRFVMVTVGVVMVSSLLLGVFFRYVLQDSLTWSDEVAMLCFSWVTLLAAALLVREGGHVRVELIEAALPWSLIRALRILIGLGIFGVGLYMTWSGWSFLELTQGEYSAAIRYPAAWRNVSLPVSGVLIMIFSITHVLASSAPGTDGDPGSAA